MVFYNDILETISCEHLNDFIKIYNSIYSSTFEIIERLGKNTRLHSIEFHN